MFGLKPIFFVLVSAAVSIGALANELDREPGASSKEQTLVVRVRKGNPKDIEIARSPEKIPAGTKVSKLNFEKVAINSEAAGVTYGTHELDTATSTSSWAFGAGLFGLPIISQLVSGVASLFSNGYYGGYNNGYGYGYGYGYGDDYANWGTPSSYYGGDNYAPYWGYSDPDYDYQYYDAGYNY